MRKFVIGVDVGGSRSRAALASFPESGNDEPDWIELVDGGSGNPNRIPRLQAFQNVSDLICHSMRLSEIEPKRVSAVHVGMSGASSAAIRYDAREFLKDVTNIENIVVVPDYELVLPRHFGFANVALICGTGSIAFGRIGSSESKYGANMTNDIGSGMWLGKRLLKLATETTDLALKEQLAGAFSKHIGDSVEDFSQLSQNPDFQLASLGELAIQHCHEFTELDSIVELGVSGLADSVGQVTSQLGVGKRGYALGLTGSILTKTNVVRDRLFSCLESRSLEPAEFEVVTEPAIIAAKIAFENC